MLNSSEKEPIIESEGNDDVSEDIGMTFTPFFISGVQNLNQIKQISQNLKNAHDVLGNKPQTPSEQLNSPFIHQNGKNLNPESQTNPAPKDNITNYQDQIEFNNEKKQVSFQNSKQIINQTSDIKRPKPSQIYNNQILGQKPMNEEDIAFNYSHLNNPSRDLKLIEELYFNNNNNQIGTSEEMKQKINQLNNYNQECLMQQIIPILKNSNLEIQNLPINLFKNRPANNLINNNNINSLINNNNFNNLINNNNINNNTNNNNNNNNHNNTNNINNNNNNSNNGINQINDHLIRSLKNQLLNSFNSNGLNQNQIINTQFQEKEEKFNELLTSVYQKLQDLQEFPQIFGQSEVPNLQEFNRIDGTRNLYLCQNIKLPNMHFPPIYSGIEEKNNGENLYSGILLLFQQDNSTSEIPTQQIKLEQQQPINILQKIQNQLTPQTQSSPRFNSLSSIIQLKEDDEIVNYKNQQQIPDNKPNGSLESLDFNIYQKKNLNTSLESLAASANNLFLTQSMNNSYFLTQDQPILGNEQKIGEVAKLNESLNKLQEKLLQENNNEPNSNSMITPQLISNTGLNLDQSNLATHSNFLHINDSNNDVLSALQNGNNHQLMSQINSQRGLEFQKNTGGSIQQEQLISLQNQLINNNNGPSSSTLINQNNNNINNLDNNLNNLNSKVDVNNLIKQIWSTQFGKPNLIYRNGNQTRVNSINNGSNNFNTANHQNNKQNQMNNQNEIDSDLFVNILLHLNKMNSNREGTVTQQNFNNNFKNNNQNQIINNNHNNISSNYSIQSLNNLINNSSNNNNANLFKNLNFSAPQSKNMMNHENISGMQGFNNSATGQNFGNFHKTSSSINEDQNRKNSGFNNMFQNKVSQFNILDRQQAQDNRGIISMFMKNQLNQNLDGSAFNNQLSEKKEELALINGQSNPDFVDNQFQTQQDFYIMPFEIKEQSNRGLRDQNEGEDEKDQEGKNRLREIEDDDDDLGYDDEEDLGDSGQNLFSVSNDDMIENQEGVVNLKRKYGGGGSRSDGKNRFDTKNLVQNFLNSFLSFIQHPDEENIVKGVLELQDSAQLIDFRNNLRNFFQGQQFNRILLKEFILEDVFRPLFLFFLQNRSLDWIQNGRMKDKASHLRARQNFIYVCQNHQSIKSWRFRYNFIKQSQ